MDEDLNAEVLRLRAENRALKAGIRAKPIRLVTAAAGVLLILSVVAVAAIAAMTSVGSKLQSTFDDVSQKL